MLSKKTILLSAAMLGVISAPALAEGKKMKEVTSIVGYNVTETRTLTGPKVALYNKMDANGDGTVTFKEYSNFSNLDNEYDAFSRMDKDNSKNISYDEFVNFNSTGKGTTEFESELHGKSVKGTNLKTRVLQTPKKYYVPIEPKIINIEDVKPVTE